MKRSRVVQLSLLGIGVGMLAGCSDNAEQQMMQHKYASKAECVKDWNESDCTQHGGAYAGGGYYGPRYYWNHGGGFPVIVDSGGNHVAAGANNVTRSFSPNAKGGSFVGKTSVASGGRGGFGGMGGHGSVGG